MIIREIRTRAVNVPLEYPVKTAVGLVATAPLVLIDLETDQGVTGHAYIFAYILPALAPLRLAVDELGRLLVGAPVVPFDLEQLIDRRLRLIGNTGLLRMASAGLDMAAWDALAKFHGVPLAKLLGGAPRPIPAYDSHAMDGVELAAERARIAAAAGFGAIKTKIGYATVEEDIKVVQAISDAAGPDTQIMVDYNQSLNVPEAVHRGRTLEQAGFALAWIEEPTLQQDYQGHAQVSRALRIPVQMGENWFGIDEMQKALDAGACAFGMPDIMKIGGVTGWLRAAAIAQSRQLPLSSHLFQEFSAHMLAVTPTAHWLERLDIAGPILADGLRFERGHAVTPDKPGAGIEWAEEQVAQYIV